MNFLSYTSLICLLLVQQRAFGQLAAKGRLIDESGTAIAFATVGIFSKGIGTITELDGSFAFELPSDLINENLSFSAVGFEKRAIKVSDFLSLKESTIVLRVSITELDEVSISTASLGVSRYQMTEKGNILYNTGTIRLDNEKNGGAMALLVQHDNAPFKVGKSRLMIKRNSLGEFKVRIRFLSVNDQGQPGEDLIEKSLVYKSDINSGWLRIDLSSENIWIKDREFFLAYEWVMDREARELLQQQLEEHLSLSPEYLSENTFETEGEDIHERLIKGFKKGVWFGSLVDQNLSKKFKCYYRLNSADQWKRSGAILAADVAISDIRRKFKEEKVDE